MHVEKAINAIMDWYDGESFTINQITTDPIGARDSDRFDQSESFLSVTGYQNSVGDTGDMFEGVVYFEFEPGKFIETTFFC